MQQYKKILCYYAKRSERRDKDYRLNPKDIDPNLCTHLLYSLTLQDFDSRIISKNIDPGILAESAGGAKEFINLRNQNRNLTLMLSIGGWEEGSSRFSKMVSRTEDTEAFVKNVCQLISYIRFDGIDINWQWPGQREGSSKSDKQNYASLIKSFRNYISNDRERQTNPLLLSVVIPPFKEYATRGFDMNVMARETDFMTLLTMDYYLSMDPMINHHAPLYNLENVNDAYTVNSSVQYYLNIGVNSQKLILGIPFYGRSYVLASPYQVKLGDTADDEGDIGYATKTYGVLAYFEICSFTTQSEWLIEKPEANAVGPYAYQGLNWVAYDDADMISRKVSFANNLCLGGVMLWTIDMDDFKGSCKDKFQLMKVAKHTMQSSKAVCNKIYSGNNVDLITTAELSPEILHNTEKKDSENKTALWRAAENGNTEQIRVLLNIGAYPNITDDLNRTIMHVVAERGHDASLKLIMIKCRYMIDYKDKLKRTPLWYATSKGDFNSIKILVEGKAHILPDILWEAVALENINILEYFIENGGDINCRQDDTGATLLFKIAYGYSEKPAAFNRKTNELTEFLINSGVDIKAVDTEGQTVLHKAAIFGLEPLISIMINHGAYVNLKDLTGKTPLHLAVLHDKTSVLNALLVGDAVINVGDENEETALHLAARNGNGPMMELLLQNGADVDVTDINGETPLHATLHFKRPEGSHIAEVLILIKNGGANVNVADLNGLTPLHLASSVNDVAVVKLFIENDANINAEDLNGQTPLHLAASSGSIATLELLIGYKADITATDSKGQTPLHIAVKNEEIAGAKILINHGANINATDSVGQSSLHIAVLEDKLKMLSFLLSNAADINARDSNGQTPLHLAVLFDKLKAIKLLLDGRVDINPMDAKGKTPLHLAASNEKVLALKILIDRGADKDSTDSNGQTPLHLAVANDKKTAMIMLIEGKADINAEDFQGRTPLHLASEGGRIPLIEILTDRGAKIDASDTDGKTPLHLAMLSNKREATLFLIEHGANLNVSDANGMTPLHIASQNDDIPLLKLLIEKGAFINASNEKGQTPLHIAVENNKEPVARILVENKADLDATNADGQTPLHTAAIKNEVDIIKLLIEAGGDVNVTDKHGKSVLDYAKPENLPIFLHRQS